MFEGPAHGRPLPVGHRWLRRAWAHTRRPGHFAYLRPKSPGVSIRAGARMAQVWGRDRELAAVERLLGGAPAGLAVLLLQGSPGMGKTVLWAAAVARAIDRGYRVLQSRPAEAEARLAFSSLSDLLSGVSHDQLQALPAPQHQALEAALLRGGTTGPTVDRRSVCMAVLGVLRSLSAQGPLLIAIDDW